MNDPLTRTSKIFVAGHRGLVGSALIRYLHTHDYSNVVCRSREELDLVDQAAVNAFFAEERPDYVFLAAAKVGGILANSRYPADFVYQNLMIEANVIHAAFQQRVRRLLFLGSSCIYPRLARQPMQEHALLSGPLEPTNEPYAIAKIAGIKLCESYNRQHGTDFRSVMPTNLYGPGDNFDLQHSHVIPALIRRFHEAKISKSPRVAVWGSGRPRREFLYVDDMVTACMRIMTLSKDAHAALVEPMRSHINIGTGTDVTIEELARTIGQVVGYKGQIEFDTTQPDGAPRKLLDVSIVKNLGWQPQFSLADGLARTYAAYLQSES